MKPEPNSRQQEVEKAGETARVLLKDALTGLEKGRTTQPPGEPRLFFPNGIRFINVQVTVPNIVTVNLTISETGKPGLTENHIQDGVVFGSEQMAGNPQDVIDACEGHWDRHKSDCSGVNGGRKVWRGHWDDMALEKCGTSLVEKGACTPTWKSGVRFAEGC